MLDLESVRLFVLTAEFESLTRAAEAANTVQPVVSQRLKSLERQLGRRLLDRSPRFVRPTAEGAVFLEKARSLLAAHDAALSLGGAPKVHFAIGASDHAVGAPLARLLGPIRGALPPHATIEVRMGLSHAIRAAFDAGALDAAVVRREAGGEEGELLGIDPLGWRGAAGLELAPDAPVGLATLGAPCGVRAAAIRALEQAGRPWRESFVAGSCSSLLAGAALGLGIAPMGEAGSDGAPDIGPALGLPPLPPSPVALLARARSPETGAAIRALAAGVRSLLR
ncbi:LysR family transcriptional regulator [Hansschlegelia zhihuaiae]|uniref:LysR family transcriptional regulator n=1 Tax=Hansschlegelia zhihuaiae TaxID=405005 RepID=A0A4Q0MR91_9HYPH|nr:LysR family transcriptional regulator [Hansschlegelia zhihuaiae]RXF75666.1 LysR family transcriptional regulator [Hansschlegelia zhihuaiae]